MGPNRSREQRQLQQPLRPSVCVSKSVHMLSEGRQPHISCTGAATAFTVTMIANVSWKDMFHEPSDNCDNDRFMVNNTLYWFRVERSRSNRERVRTWNKQHRSIFLGDRWCPCKGGTRQTCDGASKRTRNQANTRRSSKTRFRPPFATCVPRYAIRKTILGVISDPSKVVNEEYKKQSSMGRPTGWGRRPYLQ